MTTQPTLTTCLLLLAIPAGHAAAAGIDSATFLGSPGADDPAILDSITVDGVIYDDLVGAVASGPSGSSLGSERYFTVGDDPGTSTAALSSLTLTDGVLNIDNGVEFDFGVPVALDDILFITELQTAGSGPSDDITIAPIDAAGDPIGTYSRTLNNIGADGGILRTADISRSVNTDPDDVLEGARFYGSTFTLEVFVGNGTGDLSLAEGITVLDGQGTDVSAVGRVIPEPASLALLGLGGLGSLTRRRR
jgi:hypothetical protein